MSYRRTFLGCVAGAVTAVAGCSSTSGNGTDTSTPEVETLATDTEGSTSENTAEQNGDNSTDQEEERRAATPEPTVQFNANLDGMSQCGRTCREIEYTIQNRGELSAEDVSIQIQVHTEGDQVYDESQSIGNIESQTQKTGITHQIEVGIGGGSNIKGNDGNITLTLTPTASNGASSEFTFERTLDV